jgi:dTDP-glucose 4,6-dehydratase
MGKTVLLTGAAGFIGSNLLSRLFRNYPEDRFLVLDALTYAGNRKNIPDEIRDSGRFEFWYGDITNANIVNELMERANLVVHLAAETHVARSIFDNTKFFHTDVIGTQTLVNALLKNSSVERFVHISTSEVYGSSVADVMDEDHPLNPMSPYAGAKAGADRLVYSYWSYTDLPIVTLRPFNNYGPRQHLEKMVPRFVTSALKNEPLTIHGDGSAARDWLFVDDHCDAIDLALHLEDFSKIKNQVINIGTGRATSVLDVAKSVLRLLGKQEDLIKFIGNRPGQVKRHCSSTAKAKELLGWESKTSLDTGLAETVEWYRSHEPWWREQEWMKHVPIQTASGKIEMH